MALADMRRDYSLAGLLEKDLAKNPFRQFEQWFQEAEAAKIAEPNAMTLATAGRDGRPSARTVLLKGCDGRGFVFYTNYESRKGRELDANPRATLLFPWVAMERQIIIEGAVTRVSREAAEAYFHSRPRGSQLAAWASPQSTAVAGRAAPTGRGEANQREQCSRRRATSSTRSKRGEFHTPRVSPLRDGSVAHLRAWRSDADGRRSRSPRRRRRRRPPPRSDRRR